MSILENKPPQDRIEEVQRFVCIHGHFYQPPRENPWLERIEVQDSAAPFHDWNERVCSECYGPNSLARILDSQGRVEQMLNNFEWISFNVGPTLLTWLERHAPGVLRAMQEADLRSMVRCHGHGNAIAQGYNHTILPLASRRDKELQICWGIDVFRHHFRREPEGMWLPETAADIETLEVLAEHGILFTVLHPRQALCFKRRDEGTWQDIREKGIPAHRAYRCLLPSGGRIHLFFYDAQVAHQVAFQRLLDSGERFLQSVLSRFQTDIGGPQIVHLATDGETFGHHHRFGEMALAYFVHRLKDNGPARITNYGEYLSRCGTEWEVQIVEKSSWSCVHGVERWRSDCGCRVSKGRDLHQQWKAPLREALNVLKARLDDVYLLEGRKLFPDPWGALKAYVEILLNRQAAQVHSFLQKAMGRVPMEQEIVTALELLEMQRHGQLMFTSCAWFFDDIAGIESMQVLKFAARAIQLAERNSGVRLEEAFLAILERAPCNDPRFRDARELWEKEVRPALIDLERVLAHFSMRSVFRKNEYDKEGYAYSKKDLDAEIHESGQMHFAFGRAQVASHVTLRSHRDIYAVIHWGGLDVQFFWMPDGGDREFQTLKAGWMQAFREASMGDLYQVLLRHLGRPTHTLRDLFLDEQRRIVEMILRERVEMYNTEFETLFHRDAALFMRLARLRYPIPQPMIMAANVAAERKMCALLENLKDEDGLGALSEFYGQARQWGYRPQAAKWEQLILQSLETKLAALDDANEISPVLRQAERLLEVASILDITLNLWNVQNRFVEICRRRVADLEPCRDAVSAFALRILLNPKVLPARLHPYSSGL